MSDEPLSETQILMQRAGDGDPGAVDALLGRHRPALRRMVANRLDPALRRRLDASDIVQEVFVDVHRRLADYLRDPKMPFHLWLRSMARDRINDAHRRHRVAQRRSLDREQSLERLGGDRSSLDLAAQLRDGEPTPAAAALRQELNRRFTEALDQLGGQDREVIVMRHVEQLANHEVAELLDLTQPAAAMRYLRALRRLRTILAETPSQASL